MPVVPTTTVSLISGRALAVLKSLSGVSERVHLVGSHGSEFDTGFVSPMDAHAEALLVEIKHTLDAIAADYPGVTTELKPASVALHVRNASDDDGDAAMRRADLAAASWDAQVTDGKAVKEFAVIHTDKGQAVDILRDQHDASAVGGPNLLPTHDGPVAACVSASEVACARANSSNRGAGSGRLTMKPWMRSRLRTTLPRFGPAGAPDKLGAISARKPNCSSAHGACSRLEPQPKLSPATMILAFW